tara:strand:+ start:559 stop:945 length:387 start_codon:yes stop_codon:yes gene_type:complete
MTETIETVVEQLEAEHARLADLLKQKQAEASAIKLEADRVKEALTALTTPPRTTPPAKPGASRADLLTIVHEALKSCGGTLSADEVKELVKRSLKRSGRSARGLHKTLPHVFADNSLRVEGEMVTLKG